MLQTMLSGAVCVVSILFAAGGLAGMQDAPAARGNAELASTRLENVRLRAQGVDGLLSSLALSHDIPIGLESAAGEDESAEYEIDFQGGTLSDFLTQFAARHQQYEWEIRDGVVNVFPKSEHRDALFAGLLKVKIGRLSVKEGTSTWNLAESLAASPEVKKFLKASGTAYRGRGFTGPYIPQLGRRFTLDASNVTLGSLLNRVIKESPAAKFWRVTRNHHDGTLAISLSARHEDVPAGGRRPILPASYKY